MGGRAIDVLRRCSFTPQFLSSHDGRRAVLSDGREVGVPPGGRLCVVVIYTGDGLPYLIT
jgi:hypothetical protein